VVSTARCPSGGSAHGIAHNGFRTRLGQLFEG
jgi:hypothetical protein